jgi:hypothetical protein
MKTVKEHDKLYVLRISEALRTQYVEFCNKNKTKAAREIRKFMISQMEDPGISLRKEK